MMSFDARTVFLFLLAIAARLGFHLFTGFTADDAFITFRYAENIAHGLGFVYNEGERVLGTTTPLFTLLLSLCSLVRLPVITAALIISLLSSGGIAVILHRMAFHLRFGHFAWLPPLAYIFFPRTFAAETGGMETAFFTLLVTLSLFLRMRGLFSAALIAASLSALTRPEGAILLGLMMLYNWKQEPKRWLRQFALPLLIVGPWFLFALFYFGSIVPHSIIGKLALFSNTESGNWWQALRFVLALHTPFGWGITIAAIFGGYLLRSRRNYGRLEAFWMIAMVLFFTFSNSHVFFWYIVPVYPIMLLFVTSVVPIVFEQWLLYRARSLAMPFIITIGMVTALCLASLTPFEYYRLNQITLERVHKAIGLYLSRNSLPDDLVAAEDIGYMGYYSGRKILDRDGLISPEVPPYNRSGDYLGLILDYSPDWVVAGFPSAISPFHDDSTFLSSYRFAESFESGETKYRLYRQWKRKQKEQNSSGQESSQIVD